MKPMKNLWKTNFVKFAEYFESLLKSLKDLSSFVKAVEYLKAVYKSFFQKFPEKLGNSCNFVQYCKRFYQISEIFERFVKLYEACCKF